MNRKSTAVWNGSGKEGGGHVTTQSNILSKTPYTWKSRFEEGTGTNPEELIAAAHAACFSMKLSFILGAAGFIPDSIETSSTVTIDNGTITGSHLVTSVKAPGISKEKFAECAAEAKLICPVSKALNMNITLEAGLV